MINPDTCVGACHAKTPADLPRLRFATGAHAELWHGSDGVTRASSAAHSTEKPLSNPAIDEPSWMGLIPSDERRAAIPGWIIDNPNGWDWSMQMAFDTHDLGTNGDGGQHIETVKQSVANRDLDEQH